MCASCGKKTPVCCRGREARGGAKNEKGKRKMADFELGGGDFEFDDAVEFEPFGSGEVREVGEYYDDVEDLLARGSPDKRARTGEVEKSNHVGSCADNPSIHVTQSKSHMIKKLCLPFGEQQLSTTVREARVWMIRTARWFNIPHLWCAANLRKKKSTGETQRLWEAVPFMYVTRVVVLSGSGACDTLRTQPHGAVEPAQRIAKLCQSIVSRGICPYLQDVLSPMDQHGVVYVAADFMPYYPEEPATHRMIVGSNKEDTPIGVKDYGTLRIAARRQWGTIVGDETAIMHVQLLILLWALHSQKLTLNAERFASENVILRVSVWPMIENVGIGEGRVAEFEPGFEQLRVPFTVVEGQDQGMIPERILPVCTPPPAEPVWRKYAELTHTPVPEPIPSTLFETMRLFLGKGVTIESDTFNVAWDVFNGAS